MRLTGKRVLLRKAKRSDIADRQAIGRHGAFDHMCGGNTVAEVCYPKRAYWAKWYRWFKRYRHGFIIEYEGRCVGTARLSNLPRGAKSATFAIGIFDPSLWSQGLGTEATRLLLRYGFETLGLEQINLEVLDTNARGIRCYERCGFVRTGIKPKSVCIDGEWHSDILMSVRRREYELRRDLLLYAVTDGRDDPLPAIEAALRGGATMLQLREKRLGGEELLALARRVKAVADRFGVPLILNDRADLAVEIGAAGAHLGPSDGDLRAARALLGPDKILGATARTVEQALAAEAAGADYLGCGAVFGTNTKAEAVPMPPELLRAICGAVQIPVVAIGGIADVNIGRLRGCGMAGFAVVSGIFGAEDIEGATRELRGMAEEILCPKPN